MPQHTSLPDRFMQRVDQTASCWLWSTTTDRYGYGRFYVANGQYAQAHRFSYELFVGPIPDGLQLDHLCRVKNCVNPEHLEPVTHAVNQQRRYAAPDGMKSHCRHGHEFSEDNTRINHLGERECKTCRAAKIKRQTLLRQERRKDAGLMQERHYFVSGRP